MTDPVAIHLGPLEIRWYGICAAIGFALQLFFQGISPAYRHDAEGIQESNDVECRARVGWGDAHVARFWLRFWLRRIIL